MATFVIVISKRARQWLAVVLALGKALGVFSIWRHTTPAACAGREFALACEKARNTNAPGFYRQIDMTKVLSHMERYFGDMGTNAIPILLQWVEEGAQPQTALARQAGKLGKLMHIQSDQFWRWVHQGDARLRALVAADLFRLFGEKAAWTVPRLQRVAGMNTDGASFARLALERLGATGGHLFTHSLNQTNR